MPARDALEQGRARLNALSSLKVEAADAQKRCDDAETPLEPGSYMVKLGKKRFLRLTVR